MKKHSNVFIYTVCVLLFVVFVALACLSGAWPGTDFGSQILAALAGAVVAAIITLFLLQGQMASEEKKEKNSKIFEEKLRIYQDFMRELCDVVKDQKIDEEEEIRLQFQIASIAVHTNSQNILEISRQLISIIRDIKKEDKNKKEMLDQLFAISDVFFKELYNKDLTIDSSNRDLTLKNFHILLEDANEVEKHDEERKEATLRAYKDKKSLTLVERLELIKSMIPANGSEQWIYNNCVLVHEYYTQRGARGGFLKSAWRKNIALDLTPDVDDEKKLVLNVFSRTFVIEDTLKIVIGIGEGNEIKSYKGMHEARHVIRVFNVDDSNETIASVIKDTLEKLKNYRDSNY